MRHGTAYRVREQSCGHSKGTVDSTKRAICCGRADDGVHRLCHPVSISPLCTGIAFNLPYNSIAAHSCIVVQQP